MLLERLNVKHRLHPDINFVKEREPPAYAKIAASTAIHQRVEFVWPRRA
jgi:hypothetical protein